MPTYEYRCLDCEEVFEARTTMGEHESARPPCPRCGGERVEPVLSAFFAKTSRKS